MLIMSLTSCSKDSFTPKSLNKDVKYDDVYLIMGQSNATGCANQSFLESSNPEIYQKYTIGNDKVLISYDTKTLIEEKFVPVKFGYTDTNECFGPEIGISEYLSSYDVTSFIIKATISGSCLISEYVNAKGEKLQYYERTISFIKKKLKLLEEMGKNPRVRGLFWMQGESDSFYDFAKDYFKAEEHFFKYIRNDLYDYIYDHFNFVDAYISTKTFWTHADTINKCKYKLYLKYEHCYLIKTNGEDSSSLNLILKSMSHENDEDAAHYDSSSMLLLGTSAAKYLVK